MTRSLFFLFSLVAMIATLSALAIRLELAAPGVSALFQDDSGAPNGAGFGVVAMGHALFGYLAVMLLGTTMIAAAREKGARLAGLFMWTGLLICAVTALVILSNVVPLRWFADLSPNTVGGDPGWTLYPPLVDAPQQTVLGYLANLIRPETSFFSPDLLVYTDLSRYALLPAGVLLFLGAFTMLSTERGMSWLSLVGAVSVVIVATLTTPLLLESEMPFIAVGWLLPALILLACGAIRVLDGGGAWLFVMTLGTLIMTLAYVAVLVHPRTLMAAGTTADIAVLYVFPLGLAWFALPALILYRFGTSLEDTALWAVCAGLTLGLIVWLGPIFHAGHIGQPNRYVDYPDAFAVANMTASIGAFIFTALMLSAIVFLRRNRD